MAQVWFTCVVAFLCCLPLLNACTWDPNTDVEQSLDFTSYDNGAAILAYLPEISNVEECQRACCDRDVCQLALIGTPADGKSECRLVSCVKDGVDVCVLIPSTQFKVYRKIDVAGDVVNQNESEVRAAFTTDDCRLPSVVGNCRAAFPRFYYNVTSQSCQQFVYGGCGGNNNNFETQEACETGCSGVKDSHAVSQRSRMSNPEDLSADEPKALPKMTSEEFEEKCLAPSVTGFCRASIRRYFYNKGTCEQFIYGGCRGNKNNYETEEACMTTCTVTVDPRNQEEYLEPEAPVIPSSSNQDACSAPAESGRCRAAFPVFYFESSSQSCKPFIYGGCGGNQNRYSSEEECISACSGNQWSLRGPRRRWTPAFFLVATLAIMSAVLLVGLILIVVRRSGRRFLIFDDKEELLPADEWSFAHSSKTVLE